MKRHRRKKEKLRGQRSHGKGNTKNKRGAGSRGGKGRAGSQRHKFSRYYGDFGGKKAMKPSKKERSINLDILLERIPKWIEKGKVKEENGIIVIDGKIIGFDKLLGRGTIEKKLLVRNLKVSKSAREKIENAGGSLEGLESSENEAVEEEIVEEHNAGEVN